MTDEEKKAIEVLQYVKNKTPFIFWYEDKPYNRKETINTILNLIEKQSKEIEELKVNNKKLQDKAKELIYEKQQLTSALLDSTPNDKIKAKIEEVEQWELYNMKIPRLSTLDERLGAKIGIKYVLQSLLEKE